MYCAALHQYLRHLNDKTDSSNTYLIQTQTSDERNDEGNASWPKLIWKRAQKVTSHQVHDTIKAIALKPTHTISCLVFN
eukprot:m.229322 g.229322  ORF g.229322 m.229322 type:complete len:79 (-) comp15206_c3_seq3:1880-2116(-)